MMLFEKNANSPGTDNIVIVPPKPDALLSMHDEFSYSNLYDCYDVGTSAAASSDSASGGPPSPGGGAAAASFDSSAFG